MNYFATNEDFTSIQELQAGATRLIQKATRSGKYFRVLKNNKPIGVLLPNDAWENLMEDFEALMSPSYRRRIKEARKSKKGYTLEQVRKRLGLTRV